MTRWVPSEVQRRIMGAAMIGTVRPVWAGDPVRYMIGDEDYTASVLVMLKYNWLRHTLFDGVILTEDGMRRLSQKL